MSDEMRAMHFELLMKELEHADRQIGSYMDLQMKILALVFAFLGASLGLLLSTEKDRALTPQGTAKLLIIASAVASFGVLQSSINYGTALAYMHNKTHFIAPRIKVLLQLQEMPLPAIRAFRESPASPPVLLATLILAVGLAALNAGLLIIAWQKATRFSVTWWLIGGAALLLVSVIVVQIQMGRAMNSTGIAAEAATEASAPAPES